MNSPIVKVFAAVIVLVLLVPIIQAVWPKPATFERARQAFVAAGMDVTGYREVAPGLEAVAQVSMTIGSATVDIYQYGDEGKIVQNLEYQKKDAGTAIVEAWGLADALGAAKPKEIPQRTARKGMLMLITTGEDTALLGRIRDTFRDM